VIKHSQWFERRRLDGVSDNLSADNLSAWRNFRSSVDGCHRAGKNNAATLKASPQNSVTDIGAGRVIS
jgi:hypothetical protein